MQIRNVVHRGLRRFMERDDPAGLPPSVVEKMRNMISFLQEMGSTAELRDVPSWRPHRPAGSNRERWSLVVTRNWRLTFAIDPQENEIVDLDYVDYH